MSKKLKKCWSKLSGYKTYAIVVLMLALAYLQQDSQLALEALAIAGLRAGVAAK